MTVEERAKRIVDELAAHSESMASALGRMAEGVVVGSEVVHATLVDLARRHLIDQIDECAKVAREVSQDTRHTHAMNAVALLIEKRIRALAAPTEERKEIER